MIPRDLAGLNKRSEFKGSVELWGQKATLLEPEKGKGEGDMGHSNGGRTEDCAKIFFSLSCCRC